MKKYELILSSKFRKSLKLAKKRGLQISLLDEVVEMLLQGIALDVKYRDHDYKVNIAVLENAIYNPIGYWFIW